MPPQSQTTNIRLELQTEVSGFMPDRVAQALDMLIKGEALTREAIRHAATAAQAGAEARAKAAESEELRDQAMKILMPTLLPESYFPAE